MHTFKGFIGIDSTFGTNLFLIILDNELDIDLGIET